MRKFSTLKNEIISNIYDSKEMTEFKYILKSNYNIRNYRIYQSQQRKPSFFSEELTTL